MAASRTEQSCPSGQVSNPNLKNVFFIHSLRISCMHIIFYYVLKDTRQAYLLMSMIPVLRRPSQEDFHEFEATLGYMVSSESDWATV